jgi:hypothetical protein
MADKVWADWYDAVLPSLPGLPAGAPADYFIRRAAIELCDRTGVYRASITALSTIANQALYSIASSLANTEVSRVLRMRYSNTRELTHRSPDWLTEHYGGKNWRTTEVSGPTASIEFWTQFTPQSVLLVPVPNDAVASIITGEVAVRPTIAAAGVEELIGTEHFQTIADLARANAMGMSRKPYTDKEEAARLRAKVDSDVGFITMRMHKGNGPGPMRTKTYWI